MENILLSLPIFYLLIFFFGLFLGSFANVVLFRLHSGESGIISGNSHCPKCEHTLSFWDLFPVFSWIVLRGKCRYCHEKISIQYPLVELSMGVLSVFLFFMQGIGFENGILTGEKTYEGIFWILFSFFWIILFVADTRWMEVFRYISVPMILLLHYYNFLTIDNPSFTAMVSIHIPLFFLCILSLLYSVKKHKKSKILSERENKNEIQNDIIMFIFTAIIILSIVFSFPSERGYSLIIGILIPTSFFGIQYILSKYIFTSRGIWIGDGDIDFGIMIGLLLGWPVSVVALGLSYIMGSIVGIFVMRIKGRDAKIAFGPFLLISLLISLFWGDSILKWYLSTLGL